MNEQNLIVTEAGTLLLLAVFLYQFWRRNRYLEKELKNEKLVTKHWEENHEINLERLTVATNKIKELKDDNSNLVAKNTHLNEKVQELTSILDEPLKNHERFIDSLSDAAKWSLYRKLVQSQYEPKWLNDYFQELIKQINRDSKKDGTPVEKSLELVRNTQEHNRNRGRPRSKRHIKENNSLEDEIILPNKNGNDDL